MQPRTQQQEEQVQNNVGNDGDKLNGNKLNGPLLETQISKRNAQKSIECHHYNHHSDEIGMIAIFQKMRDRLEKRQAENGKYQ